MMERKMSKMGLRITEPGRCLLLMAVFTHWSQWVSASPPDQSLNSSIEIKALIEKGLLAGTTTAIAKKPIKITSETGVTVNVAARSDWFVDISLSNDKRYLFLIFGCNLLDDKSPRDLASRLLAENDLLGEMRFQLNDSTNVFSLVYPLSNRNLTFPELDLAAEKLVAQATRTRSLWGFNAIQPANTVAPQSNDLKQQLANMLSGYSVTCSIVANHKNEDATGNLYFHSDGTVIAVLTLPDTTLVAKGKFRVEDDGDLDLRIDGAWGSAAYTPDSFDGDGELVLKRSRRGSVPLTAAPVGGVSLPAKETFWIDNISEVRFNRTGS